MKKNIFSFVALAVILLMFVQPAKSQEPVSGKMLFTELGGPGVLFSINFDGRFKGGERLGWGYRLGVGTSVGEFDVETRADEFGYGYPEGKTRSYYTVPIGVNYLFGKKNSAHMFEVGAGASFLTRKVSLFYYEVDTPGHVIGHFSFMYRISPVNGGVSFRIGFTPVIGTSGDLFPMAGIGIGYAF